MENMVGTVNQTEFDEYLIVVHGVTADVMPPVAYRRVGRPEMAGRKLIKCPHCRELLTHVDRSTSVQMYGIPKGKKKEIPGMIVKRCASCKADIGMLMTI